MRPLLAATLVITLSGPVLARPRTSCLGLSALARTRCTLERSRSSFYSLRVLAADPACARQLATLLRDPDVELRAAAAALAEHQGYLGVRLPVAARHALRRAAKRDVDERVQRRAKRALAWQRPKRRAVLRGKRGQQLVDLLGTRVVDDVAAAARALTRRGALPLLVRAIGGPCAGLGARCAPPVRSSRARFVAASIIARLRPRARRVLDALVVAAFVHHVRSAEAALRAAGARAVGRIVAAYAGLQSDGLTVLAAFPQQAARQLGSVAASAGGDPALRAKAAAAMARLARLLR
ncbi:MAG: hypothetical protein KC503_22425, partial [Myxococcales bacterium]|nr:hypothetical protein [Myxococcales bacterium]